MRVLVTGATSMIGDFLLPLLVRAGHEVIATSRREHAPQPGVRWLVADLASADWAEGVGRIDAWVNFTSLALLDEALARVVQTLAPKRMIAFGSTSMFTKRYARGGHDRGLAAQLQAGEAELARICTAHAIDWNILRPTLIYCLGRDRNLTQIRRFIRRFRFFPMVGSGEALRQPVHAEDLAVACLQLLQSGGCANRAYNLSGGEIISYRTMVERLFAGEGIRACFVHVPLPALRMLLVALRALPRYRYLTSDMADRMMMDMTFPHDEAAADFGYRPRTFSP